VKFECAPARGSSGAALTPVIPMACACPAAPSSTAITTSAAVKARRDTL
jgi:hypothetical protein